MPRRFPELDALIRQVETKTLAQPDRLAAMIAIVHLVIDSDIDPYLLIGSLLDAIGTTVAKRVPAERRGEISVETVRLLRDVLKAHGAI